MSSIESPRFAENPGAVGFMRRDNAMNGVRASVTMKDLQKWIEGASYGWVAEFTVPWVASASPNGREIALKWIESKNEAIASAGWQTYSSMVANCRRRHIAVFGCGFLRGRTCLGCRRRSNRGLSPETKARKIVRRC
jgi:hypothetical protein